MERQFTLTSRRMTNNVDYSLVVKSVLLFLFLPVFCQNVTADQFPCSRPLAYKVTHGFTLSASFIHAYLSERKFTFQLSTYTPVEVLTSAEFITRVVVLPVDESVSVSHALPTQFQFVTRRHFAFLINRDVIYVTSLKW